MAPKKHQQNQKGKKKPQTLESKTAPKLQLSAENERRVRRLLLNSGRSSVPSSATSGETSGTMTRDQKSKKLKRIYESLSCEGFRSDQIEMALSALNEGATFESALDWLCLNLPRSELPIKFSSGTSMSSHEGVEGSVSIISTARADWVPSQAAPINIEDKISGVPIKIKGHRDDDHHDLLKSSQADWIRQYMKQQEEEEYDALQSDSNDDVSKVEASDPNIRAVSIPKEFRLARIAALKAKEKGDKKGQEVAGHTIRKLKQEMASLGLSDDILESELGDECSPTGLSRDILSNSTAFKLTQSNESCDSVALLDFAPKRTASIVDSIVEENVNEKVVENVSDPMGIPIFRGASSGEDEPEETELDILFSEDTSVDGSLPHMPKLKKKEKMGQWEQQQISGKADEIWKKGDSRKIPKAALHQLCQKLGWEAPKYTNMLAKENKYLYAVSVLRTATGRGKSRKAGGLISFQIPDQDEAFESAEDAQNRVAAFALNRLFPDFPIQFVAEPYSSVVAKWREGEALSNIEEIEEHRRAGFVDSLLSVDVSGPTAAANVSDISYHDKVVIRSDPENTDSVLGMEKTRGMLSNKEIESSLLKQDHENKMKSKKYKEMLEARAALPVACLNADLLQLLRENDVIVVCGETGSGKTTQVPQFILDDMIEAGCGGFCNIVCTQPRRIALAQFRGKIGRFGDLTTQTTVGIMNPGYFLNPRFHYQEGFEFSDNIRSGVTKVIERLAPNVTFAIEATREIAQFRGKIGRFEDLTAQTAVGIMNPGFFLNPRFQYVEGFLYSDNIRSGVTKVIERVAPNVTFAIEATREAISIAERVSDERCEPPPGSDGSLTGFQVRLDSARNEKTKLLFCTTGILLRKLAGDKHLADITHIIVDEVHERSLLGDFLLIVLKDLIKKQSCRRSKLKVILMSATVDSSLFSNYFGGCPVITAKGRTHPVATHFLEDVYESLNYCLASDSPASLMGMTPVKKKLGSNTIHNHRGKKNLVLSSWGDESLLSENYINPHYVESLYEAYSERTRENLKSVNDDVIDYDLLEDLIHYIDENYSAGAILIFLSGVAEIHMLLDRLAGSFRFGGLSSDWLLPLHSSLTANDQRKVFLSPPEGIRKVIVATDIAETSITINDVVYVIDCGKHKENRYNPQKKMSSMVEDWISQANARQRRGRAGRVKPGVCFCLYTCHRYEKLMRSFQVPEMLRMPLVELCLQIKSLSLGDVKSFLLKAIEPPREEAVDTAITTLYEVGALEGSEELTPLGYHLAKLPVDVLVGKMMLYGGIFGCLSPVLSIAAFLSYKTPFLYPKDEKQNIERAKALLLTERLDNESPVDEGNRQSDHLLLVVAYDKWMKILSKNGAKAAQRFCDSYFLSFSVMRMIRDMRIQFGNLLADIGIIRLPKIDEKMKDKLDSWFGDTSQPFNMYSQHPSIIKSVLCAGLYPNVAATEEGIVGAALGSSRTLNPTKGHLHWFDGRREVHIHPSSVNNNSKGFRYPFLVFLEKVETSKVFLRDTTIISPYSILLFGGSINIQHQTGLVTIDGWLKLASPAQTAVLFKELRLMLHSVLKELVRNPERRATVVENEVVSSIIHLLLEEDKLHK